MQKSKKEIAGKIFWQKMKKPFFVLAPMADVTDFAFRTMITKYGKPDIIWTEFVSADGLASTGKKKLLHNLKYSESERPIIAQLFSSNPEKMFLAAKLIRKLGFDGLDINMGCPDKKVEKQGGGAAMMKDYANALAVLEAARKGFEPQRSNLRGPTSTVSIKTRIGYNVIDLKWIELLFKQNLPALTVHLRTRKEMSNVPAHWEIMPEIVKMRDQIQADLPKNRRTLIIGNGDISSLDEAKRRIKETDCDGVMIGRGIFGKPWFFNKSNIKKNILNTRENRLKILLEHSELFEKNFGGRKHLKNFAVMKKHFKAYISGWDGSKELRTRLMQANNVAELKMILKNKRSNLGGPTST